MKKNIARFVYFFPEVFCAFGCYCSVWLFLSPSTHSAYVVQQCNSQTVAGSASLLQHFTVFLPAAVMSTHLERTCVLILNNVSSKAAISIKEKTVVCVTETCRGSKLVRHNVCINNRKKIYTVTKRSKVGHDHPEHTHTHSPIIQYIWWLTSTKWREQKDEKSHQFDVRQEGGEGLQTGNTGVVPNEDITDVCASVCVCVWHRRKKGDLIGQIWLFVCAYEACA